MEKQNTRRSGSDLIFETLGRMHISPIYKPNNSLSSVLASTAIGSLGGFFSYMVFLESLKLKFGEPDNFSSVVGLSLIPVATNIFAGMYQGILNHFSKAKPQYDPVATSPIHYNNTSSSLSHILSSSTQPLLSYNLHQRNRSAGFAQHELEFD